MKRSKRYEAAAKTVDRTKTYTVEEAVAAIKALPAAKFDETVEIVFHLGVDPKKPEQAVRGTISLPKGIGRSVRVIAFAEGEQAALAKAAGAEEAGGQELVDRVAKGWTDFDVAIATPGMMRAVGRLGRVLGPKGLMPSPKSGTVTDNVEAAVREFKAGKLEYRTDAGGNVAAPVGKRSFSAEDLKANIEAFIERIRQVKPASAKGRYILGVTVTTTMGPGIRLAVS
ncbi:MAG TPA: 50S ribosomal protein L1 [Planctomycetota bacterium]|nr:50S ribosomal protein L1 [Planctomycetota bacterium]HRR80319.1 50S ribosomal protein L1 [Planctomycetota bacterium]HRT97697.1 50S ribosomal protein L1 [Planctomycetota bacterium]